MQVARVLVDREKAFAEPTEGSFVEWLADLINFTETEEDLSHNFFALSIGLHHVIEELADLRVFFEYNLRVCFGLQNESDNQKRLENHLLVFSVLKVPYHVL